MFGLNRKCLKVKKLALKCPPLLMIFKKSFKFFSEKACT